MQVHGSHQYEQGDEGAGTGLFHRYVKNLKQINSQPIASIGQGPMAQTFFEDYIAGPENLPRGSFEEFIVTLAKIAHQHALG